MHRYILFNGRIMECSEACLSPMDRGFLLGDGIFETLRSYRGHLPFWDLHLERLKQGMSQLGFPLAGIRLDDIQEKARDLLAKNAASDAYVRLTVSRGILNSGPLPEWGTGEPNWVLFTKPLPPLLEANQKNGIKAIICSVRKNSTSPTACLKTVNYLDMIMAKREAFLEGAQEGILLDEKGHVAEAATSNLFWVKNGVLYTPCLSMPILPGITRNKILEIADYMGIPCQEGIYSAEDVTESNEAFITNSVCEVTPLISINNHNIADGRPGHMTLKLQAEYTQMIRKHISESSSRSFRKPPV